MIKSLLFVCTGNTCRSPMAEILAKEVFAQKGLKIAVASRGIFASVGASASQNATRTIEGYGFSLDDHTSQMVTMQDFSEYDLILTMTKSHKQQLQKMAPQFAQKVFTLQQYVDNMSEDILDPYGGCLMVYQQCGEGLRKAIETLAEKLSDSKGVGRMIAIGCDHGGYEMKLEIMKFLDEHAILYKDFGTHSEASTDYPIYAKSVCNAILNGEAEKGILVCGTGIGISIAANRHKGIRAALCHDVFSAKATREHNDANILAMGGRVIGIGPCLEIVKTFLETPFSNDARHLRRINMIEEE